MVSFTNNQVTIIEDYSSHKKNPAVYYYTGCAYPAYATSAGTAYIAYMSEKKRREYFDSVDMKPLTPYTVTSEEKVMEVRTGLEMGYFECDQEINEGVISFSAPIFASGTNIESVITVYGAVSEMNRKRDLIVEHLKAAASECTRINQQRLL